MSDYIDREAFVESQRHLYCENCARRKGMKRGKMQFVYEIGDAPCRACGYGDVLDDLEDFPTADVRTVRHGHWQTYNNTYVCSACGRPVSFWQSKFCPNCGADMREVEHD